MPRNVKSLFFSPPTSLFALLVQVHSDHSGRRSFWKGPAQAPPLETPDSVGLGFSLGIRMFKIPYVTLAAAKAEK